MPQPIPHAIRVAEAAALKAIYDRQAPMPAQVAFAREAGLGTGSMVYQYLTNRRPLSVPIAVKFAQQLGVPIDSFSPRLAAAAAAAGAAAHNQMAPRPAPATVLRVEDRAPLVPLFERVDEHKLRALDRADRLRLEGALIGAASLLGLDVVAPLPAARSKRRANER